MNFNVKVVFLCRSIRFAYVKDNIRPRVSFLFVVYVYTRDINCIDTQFISKKNVFDHSSSYGSLFKNSVRSKLLATHDNFAECSKGVSEKGNKPPTVLNNNSNKFNSNSLLNDIHSSKRARVEGFDDSVEKYCDDFAKNSKGSANNDVPVMSNDHFSNSELNFEMSTRSDCTNVVNSFDDCGREECKERVDGSLRINLCSRGLNSNIDVVKE
ncbi:23025_t:CDS:2 [Gigaspora rosea]|nr:23025_t:CDS:2 [Gigaspora rosea]